MSTTKDEVWGLAYDAVLEQLNEFGNADEKAAIWWVQDRLGVSSYETGAASEAEIRKAVRKAIADNK